MKGAYTQLDSEGAQDWGELEPHLDALEPRSLQALYDLYCGREPAVEITAKSKFRPRTQTEK